MQVLLFSRALYTKNDDPRTGRLKVPQRDDTFFEDCCVYAPRCDRYYSRRPADDGSGYTSPNYGRLSIVM